MFRLGLGVVEGTSDFISNHATRCSEPSSVMFVSPAGCGWLYAVCLDPRLRGPDVLDSMPLSGSGHTRPEL